MDLDLDADEALGLNWLPGGDVELEDDGIDSAPYWFARELARRKMAFDAHIAAAKPALPDRPTGKCTACRRRPAQLRQYCSDCSAEDIIDEVCAENGCDRLAKVGPWHRCKFCLDRLRKQRLLDDPWAITEDQYWRICSIEPADALADWHELSHVRTARTVASRRYRELTAALLDWAAVV